MPQGTLEYYGPPEASRPPLLWRVLEVVVIVCGSAWILLFAFAMVASLWLHPA
jgi:hypothetical protein